MHICMRCFSAHHIFEECLLNWQQPSCQFRPVCPFSSLINVFFFICCSLCVNKSFWPKQQNYCHWVTITAFLCMVQIVCLALVPHAFPAIFQICVKHHFNLFTHSYGFTVLICVIATVMSGQDVPVETWHIITSRIQILFLILSGETDT